MKLEMSGQVPPDREVRLRAREERPHHQRGEHRAHRAEGRRRRGDPPGTCLATAFHALKPKEAPRGRRARRAWSRAGDAAAGGRHREARLARRARGHCAGAAAARRVRHADARAACPAGRRTRALPPRRAPRRSPPGAQGAGVHRERLRRERPQPRPVPQLHRPEPAGEPAAARTSARWSSRSTRSTS